MNEDNYARAMGSSSFMVLGGIGRKGRGVESSGDAGGYRAQIAAMARGCGIRWDRTVLGGLLLQLRDFPPGVPEGSTVLWTELEAVLVGFDRILRPLHILVGQS